MMGAPFEDTWNAVEGAYYTAAGSGELLWLIISIAICVIAIIVGGSHEGKSYRRLK